MFRIDGLTRSATLPVPLAAGTGSASPGYFGRGDPLTGVPPTTMTTDWANMIQEELVAVVEAAGLTLDKADLGQLLAALNLLFVARTAPSFTGNAASWSRVGPDGFIEQGGVASLGRSTEGTLTLTFPTEFPNACFGVSATMLASGNVGGATTLQESALAADHATLFVQSDSNPFHDTASYRWRAWGK